MRKLIISVVSVAALVTLTTAAYGGSVNFSEADFKAELAGSNEVPPVETDTTGEAKFTVLGDAIDFELEVEDAVDILGAAGAHIHCAPAGQNGPVVVFLAGPVSGGFDGELEVKSSLTAANIVDDACGATVGELVQSMRDGNTYVNVHSTAHPSGEIRGQIEEG